MSKLIDITGQDFGYWHVIEKLPYKKNEKTKYLCKCMACGKTIKPVQSCHLRSGASTNCGCIRNQKTKLRSMKDETGKIYGFLKVIREATEDERPRTDRHGIYWNCECLHCGRKNVIVFGDYLRNGDTKSCGCINSVNESKIAQILNEISFQYKQQVTFEDLSSTGRACDRLMFDFGIFNNDQLLYLIEYDGIQHFDRQHSFSQEIFEKTQKNDKMKNNYCFDHNIPLIRIPYDSDYIINDLKLETTRFLLTKENEQEYYKSRQKDYIYN